MTSDLTTTEWGWLGVGFLGQGVRFNLAHLCNSLAVSGIHSREVSWLVNLFTAPLFHSPGKP